MNILQSSAAVLMAISMISVALCALLIPTRDWVSPTDTGSGSLGWLFPGTSKSLAQYNAEVWRVTALRVSTFLIVLVPVLALAFVWATDSAVPSWVGAFGILAILPVALGLACLPYVALVAPDERTALAIALQWVAGIGAACMYFGGFLYGCHWLVSKLTCS